MRIPLRKLDQIPVLHDLVPRAASVAFVTAILALCFSGAAAAQPAFPLHTAGRFIVDSNGARVHLNGVNWYGAESTDYVVAGLQTASLQSIVLEIKSLGFNVVRLPWSNQLYESNPTVPSYALAANAGMQGENALTVLDQVIAALTGAGIMVILDDHNSNAEWCCSTTDGNSLWYNTQYPQANWIADWQGMAQRYQSNPLVIGVDLRNEPRSPATWGGSAANDWHAAAQLGGNAVLGVNPHLLVFVEGVNYATDLSGAASLPIQLNVANQLVYEAHNYGFDYTGLSGYSDYASRAGASWGYLATGSNPQPLWVGEFGTCNTASTCINSGRNGDLGFWFNMITAYMQQNGIDWTYWSVNGTESTGSSRTYGVAESYGVLNATWNGSTNAALTARLQSMMAGAPADFTLVGIGTSLVTSAGGSVTEPVTIVPGNGFSGTVNLTCSVSGPSGSTAVPTCNVASSVTVTGNTAASATVSISTTAAMANNSRGGAPRGRLPLDAGGALLACLVLITEKRSRRARSFMILIFVAAIPLSSCGSSKANSSPGTTAGSYVVTVTGTASGLGPVTTEIPLTIQ